MPSSIVRPVFVVTGPSGAGKGTLIQLVLPRFPELALAVSATTRPQRPGEQDGVHYWFLDRAEFDRRIEAGEFLEWVDYVGNRYGTLHSEIDRLRQEDKAPLLELETEVPCACSVESTTRSRSSSPHRSRSSSAGSASVQPRARA